MKEDKILSVDRIVCLSFALLFISTRITETAAEDATESTQKSYPIWAAKIHSILCWAVSSFPQFVQKRVNPLATDTTRYLYSTVKGEIKKSKVTNLDVLMGNKQMSLKNYILSNSRSGLSFLPICTYYKLVNTTNYY